MQVRKVLETLLSREGLGSLPVYALGASSGGAFVLMLGTQVRLKAICSQVGEPMGGERRLTCACIQAHGPLPGGLPEALFLIRLKSIRWICVVLVFH